MSGDYVAFLRLRRRGAARRRTPTWSESLERSGSDFVTGSIVRWESDGPARAAVDASPARPARAGVAHRRPPRDPRRRVRVEQDVPARLLGRRPGLAWPEGCATRTSRRPRAPSWPGASTCSPRSSTTGGSATTARRSPSSARSLQDLADRLGDQADGARRGRGVRRSPQCSRSSSTGCWPATCTATSSRSRAAPTTGGSCCGGRARSSGASAR